MRMQGRAAASRGVIAIVALVLSGLSAARCSSSSTSTTAPTSDKCQVTASSSPNSFTPAGGTGSLSITTERDCTWTIATNAAWVSFSGTHDGQGAATIVYNVAANPVPSPRSGAIVVASESVQLSQAAAPCQFSISPASASAQASGTQLSVGLTTLTGCSWIAASGVPWITIQSGQSGSASATVSMAVAANAGAARVGQVNIGGQTYTVSQTAVLPGNGPPPPPPPPPPDPVKISGSISKISGQCPVISFSIGKDDVATSQATTFAGGSCTDIKRKTTVDVTGLRRNDGTIDASLVVVHIHD